MSDHPPSPPTELPDAIVDTLDEYSAARLRALAQYAAALVEYRERAAEQIEVPKDGDPIEDRSEDLPADVPGKATLTTKTINDNRYHYWQWREGDQIKSKYKGPAPADQ